MKVRVAYTIDVDDEYRLALAHHFGQHGKASRKDVAEYQAENGSANDSDLLWEWEHRGCQECGR